MKNTALLRILVVSLIFFIYAISGVYAETYVVVNSQDWRDVYLGLHYSNLNEYSSNFMTSPLAAPLTISIIPPDNDVLIIESSESPYFKNFENSVREKGFTNVRTIYSKDSNSLSLQLARELNIKNFILVDDSYGYNALSIAPYALLTNSWVLFVNSRNLDDLDTFLSDIQPQKVLLYGHLSRNIKDTLSKYNPEIIDNKNRFKDNLEIAKKFLEIKDSSQILLSNGKFIEKELMSGSSGKMPVVFIGINNVPPGVYTFVENNNIKYAVVIDNDLWGAARMLRDGTDKKLNVFVKFGQGYTGTSLTKPGQVYTLNRFILPKYSFNLSISSVTYNTANKALEVEYTNNGNIGVYVLSNIQLVLNNEDGSTEQLKSLADNSPFFVEASEIKTLEYPVNIDAYIDRNITAEFYTLYGEFPEFMEKYILSPSELNPPYITHVDFISFEDSSKAELVSVHYDKSIKRFFIKVKNIGTVPAYVDAEIKRLVVNDIPTTYGYDGAVRISPGGTGTLMIKVRLDDVDIADNPQITVTLFHGERKNALIKSVTYTIDLVVKSKAIVYTAVTSIIFIIIASLVYALWRNGILSFGRI